MVRLFTFKFCCCMIEPVTFDIFEPAPKKFRLSRDLIALGLTIVVLSYGWLRNSPDDLLTVLFALTWVATVFYFLISSIFLRKPLNGNFDGEVEFTHEAIVYKGSPYYLSEITAIDFSFNDYYNKYIFSYPNNTLNQRRSQGVNNYVEFTVMHKDSYIIYFRCEDEDHHRLLDPFINECIRLNKKRRIE
jgi:hypothetical protein